MNMSMEHTDVVSVKLLEIVFTSENTYNLIHTSETHDAALKFVGQVVRIEEDPDRIGTWVRALLPKNYEGNTLSEIPEMVKSAIEKGFNDVKRATKEPTSRESIGQRVVKHLLEAGYDLQHDKHMKGYLKTPLEGGGSRNISLKSKEARLKVSHIIFTKMGKVPHGSEIGDILNTLEAMALYGGPEAKFDIRLGGTSELDGFINIDLGHTDGNVVSIDRRGWNVNLGSEIEFYRPAGFKALPTPVDNGSLDGLRSLLQLEDATWLRILAFLLNCLSPVGPYFCLLVEGEQGSGKSFLCEVLKQIIDPNRTSKFSLPESPRDLMIIAKDNFLPVFDNASGMKGEISDALCRLATGGGMAFRALYTDEDLHEFDSCRPFIINGISDFVTRPDLLERAILIALPSMPKETRRTEADMRAEFERILPGVLGALYQAVACALRNLLETEVPTDLRMIDAARWITAAEPQLGIIKGSLVEAIRSGQADAMSERVQNDPVVVAISKVLEYNPVQLTMSALLREITEQSGRPDRFFPSTPAHLSKKLRRLAPALEHIGVHVEFLNRTSTTREVLIWRDGQDPSKPPTPKPSY